MSGLLELKRITVTFGGVTAVNKVSFQVDQGELLSLIGPNGAGKTTLLKSVIGSVTPETAEIRLQGLEISSLPTHERVRLGLALTNQIVRPFASMRVVDNVTLAAGHPRFSNVLKTMFAYGRNLERDQALHYLDLVGIAGMKDSPTTGLPLGVLKRLELARALALEPKLLLLDEPLAGLNQQEAARLADTVQTINAQGLTVVMIEHNLGEVLRVSQRLVVLDNGSKIADGPPEEVMQDSRVRAAYIGKEEGHVAA